MADPVRRRVLTSLGSMALGGMGAAVMSEAFSNIVDRANAREMKTIAERLGYRPDDKLLIVHADDLGVAHAVNAASIKALDSGAVSSASIMVPCPWLPEIAAYAKTHPQADLGLHLTLTSEWALYRWGPVSPRDRVPTLVASDGYFYTSESEATDRINPKEAEIEIRAQIVRARSLGINPTHLDSHMGVLFKKKELFEVLVKVGRDYNLPVLAPREFLGREDFFAKTLGPRDILIDRLITITPDVQAEKWANFYSDAIRNLQPGVTLFLIHPAFDGDEMRAVTFNHPDWGAEWRQRDFDFFTSDECRARLAENNIKVITWRLLGKLLRV
jgi:chitin disaccharide deacetylase